MKIVFQFILFICLYSFSINSQAGSAGPDCDQACLEKRAFLGDGRAAYQIANKMLYSDRVEMKRWYRISAENGYVEGQYSYAHFLALDSVQVEDCYRSIFWFWRAQKGGHKLSAKIRKILLEIVDKKEDFSKGCRQQYLSAVQGL
jgi:TPR repeat protein